MPSQFDEDFAEVGLVNLIDLLGESLVHWPAGVEADAVSVSGVFEEHPPERDTEGGESVVRKATIVCEDSVGALDSDVWVRGSERWETLTVRTEFGAHEITVVREERQTTRPARRGLMRR